MAAPVGEQLLEVIEDLRTHIRLLSAFGVRQVAERTWRPEATVSAGQRCDASARRGPGARAASAAVGEALRPRAQAHLFAPAEPTGGLARPAQRPSWQPSPLSAAEAAEGLLELRRFIGECTRCPLSTNRHNIVFGEGDPRSSLALVGEGPGLDEDRSGRPFVGPAGQLLERILAAMGLLRDQVYICNVVKCRPPRNRTPSEVEMRTCGQFLEKQLAVVRPRHILCLGQTAARYLLNTDRPMGKLRGRFYDHPETGSRIMPTYHPAYLLRNESAKRLVWQDVQKVMAEMADAVEGEDE